MWSYPPSASSISFLSAICTKGITYSASSADNCWQESSLWPQAFVYFVWWNIISNTAECPMHTSPQATYGAANFEHLSCPVWSQRSQLVSKVGHVVKCPVVPGSTTRSLLKEADNKFPGFILCLQIACAVPSFHTVSLTHQRLVANTVLHLLLPGEGSCEKAGMYATGLFRAPNRRSAEEEEIETEMTKSYRCLENQKTNAGCQERPDNSKSK